MAELVASSLLDVLFDKLGSETFKRLGLLMGMDKQLEKLRSTFSTLQDVLEDAEARQVKGKSLKGWLKKLKDVAYDADDVLDKIATKAEETMLETTSGKNNKFLSFFSESAFCYEQSNRIKEILERLDEIAEERSKFHLQERVVVKGSKEDIGVLREETGSFVNESEVYGRKEDREKIVDFLINNMSSPSGDDLGVMAIVGLGGLGKTTVAQLVYNDERVDGHFEIRMWVCVSDDSDTKKICRSIIESVRGTECNLRDMDSLERTLRKELRGKRFLLVLDDVWDEKYINWNRLRSLLSCGAEGSKILVTTRIQTVACTMGTVPPHSLAVLSEDDCWTLFEKRAFGLGGANKTPILEAIGREIVKKCGGVPLAATALGSLMRFKKMESEWLTVKESELWELPDDENEILPALRLSYSHLPSRLKQCFAYCSIFPKDHEIKKEKLVQLWIAEGFIRSSNENTHLEDMGFKYVDELLSRSLLQNASKYVKMHDLVHDIARSVAGEECSIVDASTGKGFFQSSRYSSFLLSEDISAILEPLNQANKLRTFHLINSGPGHQTTTEGELITTEEEQLQKLLDVIFSKSKLLRAIYLGRTVYTRSLPDSVCNLEHLRYLHLKHALFETLPDSIGDLHNLLTLTIGCCNRLLSLPSSIGRLTRLRKLNLSYCESLQALPESVSSLQKLQELDLNDCTKLVQLPENTSNMRSLLHLNTRGCDSLTCMPSGLGQLSHLRTLSRYVLGKENQCSLGELGGLNLLEGDLEIYNLENVRNAAEARSANLREKHRLRSLELNWNSSSPRMCFQEDDVLQSLQPHTNLEELTIDGYLGRKFPSWMLESSLPNLVRIWLMSSCFRCERLPPFGQLPKLKLLTLRNLTAVKCLGSDFYGGDGAFPMLETLCLYSMPALEEWSRATATGGEIFPSLSFLSITDCPKLKALPSTFPFITHMWITPDEGLLLSALQDGAFSNLKSLKLNNNNFGSFGDLPQVIKERMASIHNWTDAHLTQLNSIQLDSSVSSDHLNRALSPVQLN